MQFAEKESFHYVVLNNLRKSLDSTNLPVLNFDISL